MCFRELETSLTEICSSAGLNLSLRYVRDYQIRRNIDLSSKRLSQAVVYVQFIVAVCKHSVYIAVALY